MICSFNNAEVNDITVSQHELTHQICINFPKITTSKGSYGTYTLVQADFRPQQRLKHKDLFISHANKNE